MYMLSDRYLVLFLCVAAAIADSSSRFTLSLSHSLCLEWEMKLLFYKMPTTSSKQQSNRTQRDRRMPIRFEFVNAV